MADFNDAQKETYRKEVEKRTKSELDELYSVRGLLEARVALTTAELDLCRDRIFYLEGLQALGYPVTEKKPEPEPEPATRDDWEKVKMKAPQSKVEQYSTVDGTYYSDDLIQKLIADLEQNRSGQYDPLIVNILTYLTRLVREKVEEIGGLETLMNDLATKADPDWWDEPQDVRTVLQRIINEYRQMTDKETQPGIVFDKQRFESVWNAAFHWGKRGIDLKKSQIECDRLWIRIENMEIAFREARRKDNDAS